MNGSKCALILLALSPSLASAQEREGGRLSLVGLVDAYYAYDFTEPPGGVRPFATEPSRHNEFNLNLALIRAQYDAERFRASVGLATGTYVEANYAAEPDLLQNIFEAYAGVNLGGGVWLDAGVLPSHIGFESAITPLNATYSRSLIAEFSPFYETGARLTIEPGGRLTAAFLVVNGWQNIRETNDGKAVGVQLQYRPSDRLLLNYSNYLGDEAAGTEGDDDPEGALRFFNDFYAQLTVSERVSVTGAFDIGVQKRQDGVDDATWYAAALVGSVVLDPRWTLGLRAELFHDPDEAVITTSTGAGFEAVGASVNLDHRAAEGVLLRLEARLLGAGEPVFPGRDELEPVNGLIVSSIAITF